MDKVRFLMSDTGAQITEACREALEQKGVEVTVVEKDGNKVLQKMLAVRPQVVLLDAFMPGLDAISVKQRCDEKGIQNVLFFVTGSFTDDVLESEMMQGGFSFYFLKTFDASAMAARVMAKEQVRRLPVTGQGGLVGYLTLADLSRVDDLSMEAGECLGEICAPVRHLD